MGTNSAGPRANTFSICAVDTDTGETGVAVASRYLSVGGLVPYAEPGVGAIATQATCNPNYGTCGLELLRKGVPASEVVRRLTDEDVTVTPDDAPSMDRYRAEQLTEEGVDYVRQGDGKRIVWLTSRIRQLGVVDRQGNAAGHNGARIFPWAGSTSAPGYCCQGNLLAGPQVIRAMADSFEESRAKGASLVAALLAALVAGEAAGGDRRGKQAAGILVVRDRGNWTGSDRYCDIRVDDHADPVGELSRILKKTGFVS